MTEERPKGLPVFLSVLSCRMEGADAEVTFLGSDGEVHQAILSADARIQLLKELQVATAGGPLQEILTISVTGLSTAVSAEGKALILRSAELGTMAVTVNNRVIARMQAHLAELLAAPESPSTKN